jgi:hypothetical protein
MGTTTDTTTWACSVNTSGSTPTASLTVSLNGGTPAPFTIKGVCYSPCPIGGSNAWGPNIGDWFWDTYDGVTSWIGTWTNDLSTIAALGANTIRVYSFLNTQLPPAPATQAFTHTDFLDGCYANGLSVIVGIPLPPQLFDLNQTPQPSAAWWTSELQSTVAQEGAHPAVLGFIIANEVDNGNVDTYGPTANATYWWSQVQAMAAMAKAAAPGKLVGIANHDDPGICQNAASYMATCTDVDFWGVNTYQPQSFSSVFGGGSTTGYATLTGAALKPVILTEYGFPSTSRPDALTPTGIYSDATTEGNVAVVLNTMLPLAFQQPLNLGLCYFEYCDEWWNQSGYTLAAAMTCPGCSAPNCPNSGNGGSFQPPNTYTWYGGPIACGFPNYYWDNDGFGLYSVGVGQGRTPSQPWDATTNAPALPLDTRTPRQSVITALSTAFGGGAGGSAAPAAKPKVAAV